MALCRSYRGADNLLQKKSAAKMMTVFINSYSCWSMRSYDICELIENRLPLRLLLFDHEC
jgi:hypothetical protein